jgi:outer membrane lipoprotein carrier protein
VSVLLKSSSGSKASIVCMTVCAIAGFAIVPGSWTASRLNAADLDVPKILKGVEDRYNRTQTLQVSFTESLTVQGRKRTEKGELYLRKPGKMRWEYAAGKLFVSDGKYIYSYFPNEKRAEKESFKQTEDMRAPLAFLLGRLNFNDDFREFHLQPDRENVFITAIPKSDKLPYSEVTFLVSPDSMIHYLSVKGQEGSVTEFTFEGEKKNPVLSDALFRFTPPPGVEYNDSTRH